MSYLWYTCCCQAVFYEQRQFEIRRKVLQYLLSKWSINMSQTAAKKSTSDNQDTSKSNIDEEVKSEKVEV